MLRLFPGCTRERAEAIHRPPCRRAGKRPDRAQRRGVCTRCQAVTLAVAASVRREDTDYDRLLIRGVPQEMARERVGPEVD